jgi:hypothetical protein
MVLVVTGCDQTAGAPHPPSSAGSSSPTPSASGHYATAKDAAIAAMEAKTGAKYRADEICPSGASCLSMAQVFGNTDPNAGFNAAYVQMRYGGSGGGVTWFTYLTYDTAGWHLYPPIVWLQQGGLNPIMGSDDQVQVSSDCGNVRQQPSLSAKVVACLKNGTTVAIDTIPPRYVDGHIWWSVNHGQGFMAHDVLIT